MKSLNAITLAVLAALPASALAQAQQQSNDQARSKKVDETIVIQASPLNKTALESTQPVNIISGDDLKQKQAHSLGETLALEPGINNTHFATVAGSPIIRGLGGPRVKVTQNGLDTGDVSRGSPDHAVTTETSTAEQIEVMRGPATLLYGSGAIGGVVNVVDQRIPSEPVYGIEGGVNASYDSVNNGRSGSYDMTMGNGEWVLYVDAHRRLSDNYDTPDFINDEGEVLDEVENSFVDSKGGTVGASYQFDKGYFGISYQGLYQEYGIPGHEHHHHEEEGHEEEGHDEGLEHAEEAGPFADLEQQRWQIAGELRDPFAGFEAVEMRAAITDYQHSEIEGATVGTQFKNQQKEVRVIAKHAPLAGWTGAVGFQWDISDKTATGEEAFTPDTQRRSQGVFWVVEREIGDHHVDLGIRQERTDLSSTELTLDTFNATSLSAGYMYHIDDASSLSINLSHSERAPSATEVFSNGEHFATRTYELGTLYELHDEGNGEYHLHQENADMALETSNNIDLGYHYETERFHLQANVFYNRVDDFIYERFTGISSTAIHTDEDHDEHAGEEAHDHDHEHDEEGLMVVQFSQADVNLYGYELEADYRLTDAWSLHGFSDYTRAELRDGGDLPRIPAQRVGTEVRYQATNWDGAIGYTRYLTQDKIAANETETDGFGLLNARASFYPNWLAQYGATVYVKGENLTNQLGRVHSSFLKDDAPMAGRNFKVGVSVTF
ncbi:TonB-dependent receptor [Idiomarina sp. UBA3162]|uniref:TonB-dependent receptor n=1 Tax=Idiomarina sp. UBA3162 TaxID=1946641 RepID=UPI000C98D7F2|nr:TonB-dependent receptor [Idiomarina sp. UBA3162]MAD54811.1 hypothetical protein [Idiomarinaceae bacterium]